MRKSSKPQINQLLLDNPDGLTAEQIAAVIGSKSNVIRTALRTLTTAYISHWNVSGETKVPVSVWKAVIVPANATRPPTKKESLL
jgi:hypothetical protein